MKKLPMFQKFILHGNKGIFKNTLIGDRYQIIFGLKFISGTIAVWAVLTLLTVLYSSKNHNLKPNVPDNRDTNKEREKAMKDLNKVENVNKQENCGSGSSDGSVSYVLRSEVTKKAFQDLFGCDADRFAGVKVYVDGQGYGTMFKGVLEDCGMNISTFMKGKDGVILFD